MEKEGSNVQDVTRSVADGTTTMPGAAETAVPDDRRAVIGRARHEVPTPALILDLDVARRNIAEMARRMSAMPARLRPHVKLHKSPQIARMQVEAGAIGVSTATVWEAGVMARAGIANILIANQVVGREKIAALAAAAHLTSMTVAVDDERNLADLSAAACAAGSEIGVLVEIDVGMGRSGAQSARHRASGRLLRLHGRLPRQPRARLRRGAHGRRDRHQPPWPPYGP